MSEVKTEKYNSGIAILLNLLWTGAGNLYLGQTQKGFIMLGAYFVLWLIGVSSGGAGFMLLFPYWVWGLFDASNSTKVENAAHMEVVEEAAKKSSEEQKKLDSTTSVSDFITNLDKSYKLFSANVLTKDEFDKKKESLISGLIQKPARECGEDFLSALVPLIEKKVLEDGEVQKIKSIVL